MQVLVTGAAGHIGRAVCRELASRGHTVRGLDRAAAEIDGVSEFRVGDIADGVTVHDAVAGMDAVVHLAATPDDADFMTRLLEPNIIGVYHVCDACRVHKVKRLVLTSSAQVISGRIADGRLIRAEDGFHPRNHYGATKVFMEALGRVYADRHGMSVVVIRPGWCPRTREAAQRIASQPMWQSMYLSDGDAGRIFTDAVEAPDVKYAVVFATSRPSGPMHLDIDGAREAIGYQPRDTWPQGVPAEWMSE